MKKIFLNLIVALTILLVGTVSCEKNKDENNNSTATVKKILELEARMHALNAGTGKMTNFMSVIGYSQLKEGRLDMNGTGCDSTYTDSIYIDTTNYWEPYTCATVIETDNPDGTHTTVYDYGEGCYDYGFLTSGKITYTWKNENNSYFSEVIYENYYSYGVEMNGTSSYSFTSDGNSRYIILNSDGSTGDSTVTSMPVSFNWSGTSTGHEDITMIYDGGSMTYYKSDYSNKWDSISYIVLQGEYYCTGSTDTNNYEYHYLVELPLVTDYRCMNAWVPVSGIETITTTENGESSGYSLNYGNGACDNLAELTQDGETSVIDFSELYKVVEDSVYTVEPANGWKKR